MYEISTCVSDNNSYDYATEKKTYEINSNSWYETFVEGIILEEIAIGFDKITLKNIYGKTQ